MARHLFILILQCTILAAFIQSGLRAFKFDEIENNPLQKLSVNNIGFDLLNNVSRTPQTKLSSECLIQLQLLNNGLTNGDKFALQFIDSWGKIPSGILYMHLLELGNFDECMRINVEINEEVMKGKYCLSSWPVTKLQNGTQVQIGICFPDLCRADEIEMILRDYLNSTFSWNIDEQFVILDEDYCQIQGQQSLNAVDWLAIGIFILIALFVVFSTFYDCFRRCYANQSNKLLVSFSLRINLKKAFLITPRHINNSNSVHCLHGIRAISFMVVVFIHSYLMSILGPNINNTDIEMWFQSPLSMFYQGAMFVVDSFFFLSGFLVIFGSFRTLEINNGKLNIFIFYAHRYIRLTPVLALTILFYVTLYRFMGSGPLWNNFISAYQLCDETWWHTLIYIQNYLAPDRMCLVNAWYLAVDFQLYVVSPLVLLVLWKWKWKGLIAIGVGGLLLAAYLLIFVIIDDLNILIMTHNIGNDNKETHLLYYATHARALPWVIGIIFGYTIYKRMGRCVILSKKICILGWITAFILFGTFLFALYPKVSKSGVITPVEGAFYITFGHIGWALVLCWIVFVCINGSGGPVNNFLSWSFWEPISNLSYCMYVCHFVIGVANIGRSKTNTYFSNYDVMLRFWSNFSLTFIVGLIIYVCIEAPVANIDKLIFPNRKGTARNMNASETNVVLTQEVLVSSNQ